MKSLIEDWVIDYKKVEQVKWKWLFNIIYLSNGCDS